MKSCKYIIYLFSIVSIYTINIFGQGVVIKKPQPATMRQNIIVGHPNQRNTHSPINTPFSGNDNRRQQQAAMYEQDRLTVERMNAQIQQASNDFVTENTNVYFDLPSKTGAQGTEHFFRTAHKLFDMLNGKTPLNLKDAVFSVENAYYEGLLDRKKYEERISQMAEIAKLKAQQDGYNWNNSETKNIMIFRVMSDTLSFKFPMQEKSSISFPMQYDFDDFRGENDRSKLFVTKLLMSHKGQCHSLPLLYLILCEQVGADASLAFSPQHSYIKFKDKQNNWFNIELTQGRLTTDAFIIGSGFINSAAIKHGVYMQPQTKQQVIAHCLSDLAAGYVQKYGYDDFVIHCVDSALSYAPTNSTALALRYNYHGIRLQYVAEQIGRPPLEILKTQYPDVYKMYEERNSIYRRMDEIGFVDMPKEAYDTWLNSVNEEKERREHDIRYKSALRLIK